MDQNVDDIGFDLCLAKATDLLNNDNNHQNMESLVDYLMQKREYIPVALRFLAHKIQSPQELESIKALQVLEHLVNRCDSKFIQEVAKFRFLNELIRVVSPKYLAHRSPKKSKERIIELLFRWSIELKNEPKIFEAYQMLKKQGLVTKDPVHALPHIEAVEPPAPRPKDEIWDKEENALTLQRLIQSQNPEDLIEANKMIKLLAQEADKKIALKERCKIELETVYNNTRVLSDVLNYYNPIKSSSEETELVLELYENCEKLRPRIFRLAADLDENDPILSEILAANDELTKVINLFKSIQSSSKEPPIPNVSSPFNQPLNLLDFNSTLDQMRDDKLINDHFENNFNILSGNTQAKNTCLNDHSTNSKLIDDLLDVCCSSSTTSAKSSSEVTMASKQQTQSTLDELEAFMRQSLNTSQKISSSSNKLSLNDLKAKEKDFNGNNDNSSSNKENHPKDTQFNNDKISSSSPLTPPPLVDLFVPLDTIKPSSRASIVLNDENGVRTVLNYGQNVSRKDVTAIVITTTNTNEKSISKLFFQASAPKGTRIKLQAPSATNLPSYNPFLPPSAITQVLLVSRLSDDFEKKVTLEYSIEYVIDSKRFSKKDFTELILM